MKVIGLKFVVASAAFLIGIAGTTFWFLINFSSVATEPAPSVANAAPRDSMPVMETTAIQNTKSAKPIKQADKRKIDELINSLGRGTMDTKQKYEDLLIKEELLVKFVEMDSARRSYAAGKLIAEIKQACQANGKYIHSDFYRVQFASNILAQLEVIEALDTLIDCSNRRSPAGGLSPYNYATVPAIVKYKEKAFPALIRKIGAKETDREVKDKIPSIWTMITGKRLSF